MALLKEKINVLPLVSQLTLRDIFVILGIDFTIEYGVVNVYRVPFHPDTFSIFGDELFSKSYRGV